MAPPNIPTKPAKPPEVADECPIPPRPQHGQWQPPGLEKRFAKLNHWEIPGPWGVESWRWKALREFLGNFGDSHFEFLVVPRWWKSSNEVFSDFKKLKMMIWFDWKRAAFEGCKKKHNKKLSWSGRFTNDVLLDEMMYKWRILMPFNHSFYCYRIVYSTVSLYDLHTFTYY